MSLDTSARLTCPRCGTPNAPGAAFCANCGAPMGATAMGGSPGAAQGPPPPWPPQPPPPPMTGAQAQASMAMPAAAAYAAVLSAAGAMGRVTGQQPPSMIQFEVARKSWWVSAGFTLRYRTEAAISPGGPRDSLLRVVSKLDWSSVTPLFVITGVGALLGLFILNPIIYITAMAVAGYRFYRMAKWAQILAQDAVQRIASSGPQSGWTAAVTPPLASQAQWSAPPPERSAGFSPAQPPSHEALQQLKTLHDTGVISDEEYSAKKAEVLARL